MRDFYKWVEDKKLDLPTLDTNDATPTTDENRIRTGIKFGYPDAYVAAQYPPAYYPAHSATAYVDLLQRKQSKSKAPSDKAP